MSIRPKRKNLTSPDMSPYILPFHLTPLVSNETQTDDKIKEEPNEDFEDAYDEKDLDYLKKLKKKSVILYHKFVESKKISLDRSIQLKDILTINVTNEKRATLLEKYESVHQLIPYTQDYFDSRNHLRNLFNRYANKKLISEDPDIEIFKKKLTEMCLCQEYRNLIEEKIDEYQESEGDEKSKLKRWLTLCTQLPFDKMSHTNDDIVVKLQETKLYLDQSLFGMENVKERLLIFLNKKLRNSAGSKGCNLALIGKPGVGKCLHPYTNVRMADLSIKRAKDIETDDYLLGDDCTPRRVTSTIAGLEEMFEITQEFGESYTVNKSHILTVMCKNTLEIIDLPLLNVIGKEYLYTPVTSIYNGPIQESDSIIYGLLYSGEEHKHIITSRPPLFPLLPASYLEWTLSDKIAFYVAFTCHQTKMRIYINVFYKISPIIDLLKSAGIRCRRNKRYIECMPFEYLETFRIQSVGIGHYCGFTITDNGRFLLSDWTVTHNTAIAKALSKCLDLPFSQVSFGGVTSSEFLLGHDYTYIGSRPGEITRCLSRMGTKNGILFFDEFDKASDRKEIMSTLLHVTDFSQNNEFRDNYFPEFCQDLSKVWFIYSMNELPKDPAMLDRLEIIKVDGYSFNEKKMIAKQYLFPKFANELRITDEFSIDEKALNRLLELDNTDGVRDLERAINLLMEKIYFFLYNRGMDYEYDWFRKMKTDDKVIIDEELIDMIIKKKEIDIYSNLYS